MNHALIIQESFTDLACGRLTMTATRNIHDINCVVSATTEIMYLQLPPLPSSRKKTSLNRLMTNIREQQTLAAWYVDPKRI